MRATLVLGSPPQTVGGRSSASKSVDRARRMTGGAEQKPGEHYTSTNEHFESMVRRERARSQKLRHACTAAIHNPCTRTNQLPMSTAAQPELIEEAALPAILKIGSTSTSQFKLIASYWLNYMDWSHQDAMRAQAVCRSPCLDIPSCYRIQPQLTLLARPPQR